MDRSFTVKSTEGLLSSLGMPIQVSRAFNPKNGVPDYPRIAFDAMWDTGATKSVITQRVVDALGLKPIRSVFTQGVHGMGASKAYVVNIYLPDGISMSEWTVIGVDPGDVWYDLIIGMDLISMGDFSVRNVNGKTEWSFSIPGRQSNAQANDRIAVEGLS